MAEPFNPVAVAISMNAGFVARAFSGDIEETSELVKQAVSYNGFAVVDILQPCVTFNRVNTFKWFKEHTYYLEEDYKPSGRISAFRKSTEADKMPLGVIYKR